MKYNLEGQKFGRLLVIKEAGRTPGRQVVWECKCDCGNKINVRGQDLRNDHTKSCGCYKKEKSTAKRKKKKNDIKILNNVVIIFCSLNQHFLIDLNDYNKIKDYRWWVASHRKDGYCCVEARIKNKHVKLSRYLLGVTDPKIYVDHINGDPLDNRRLNLRIATPHQNAENRRKISETRPYKGVSQNYHKWVARIGWMDPETGIRENIYLGSFNTPEEAAMAYDAKAIELFDEFASLNFPGSKI